jgi:hypothetical protein
MTPRRSYTSDKENPLINLIIGLCRKKVLGIASTISVTVAMT